MLVPILKTAEINTCISQPVEYLLNEAFFSVGSFGYLWKKKKKSAFFKLESPRWYSSQFTFEWHKLQETLVGRGRWNFYYVLGEESLSVYSLGTDTSRRFSVVVRDGSHSLPTHSLPSTAQLWSQNSTFPTFSRTMRDFFFLPLAYSYSWILGKQGSCWIAF